MAKSITPVILCGGAGSRLWPLSTPDQPKQVLKLFGELTLLQSTAVRISETSRFAAPILVSKEGQESTIEAQLQAVGCAPAALVLEPEGRNTAPAIALAALAAPESVILVMPSDHIIVDHTAFIDAIDRATDLAEKDWLVTFGIVADRPETGFGYIKLGDVLAKGAHRVAKFIEKPALSAAQQMLREGGYSWNSGIFLFRSKTYLEALNRHAPQMLAEIQASMSKAKRSGIRICPDAALFKNVPAESIDYAVLEKAERVAVVPVQMGWSDVGSWDAVHAIGDANALGTVEVGNVYAIDAQNCLIRSDGPTIAAVGISDLIVVATKDNVLIVPRGRSQEVKKLLGGLRDRPE